MNTRKIHVSAAALAMLTLNAPAWAKKETGRQVIDKFFAVVDSKSLDRLSEVEVADFAFQTPLGAVKSSEGHKKHLAGFATAFPNFVHRTSRCVEAGDTISCEGVFSGDHTGPMMTPDGKTIAATQKHVDLPYLGIATFKQGKLTTLNVYFDNMAFMMQLGLLPPPSSKMASK